MKINPKNLDLNLLNSRCKYTEQGIPKIIHQIWINENNLILPEEWKKSPIEWEKTHSDYIYILWEKESSIDFVKKYYPKYLNLYNNMQYTTQRCDLIRYMFMHKIGGFYCDLDNYPLENLEKYLDKNVDVYFTEMKVSYHITINTNLMISKKNINVFLEIIDHIEEKSKENCYTKLMCVSKTQGYKYIEEAILKKKYKIFVLPYQKFNPFSLEEDDFNVKKPGAVMTAVKGGSWHSWDMKILLFLIKNIVLIILLIIIVLIIILFFYLDKKRKAKLKIL